MEGEHQEGGVDRDEVHVGSEPGQAEEPKREEESQEKRATEEMVEPLFRPLHEMDEEVGTAAPEMVEEDAGEQVSLPSPVHESSAPEVEEPEALPAAAGMSSDDLGEPEPVAVEAGPSEAVVIDTEKEHETPKPPKKRARPKKATHKRTDGGRKRPARKRAKKASAKRSAKKRKKSRA